MRFRFGGIAGFVVTCVLTTGVAQASFTPAKVYAVGATASAVGYGDFNNDGIVDLIVARPTRNDVVVMLGRPDGTLAPPLPPIPVGQNPVAVTSCISPYMFGLTGLAGTLWWPGQLPSFNSDQRCDIAVSDAGSGDVAVLVSNGDGTFAPAKFIPVGGTPGAIVGDVLDDGAGGVVFAEPQNDRLGVIHFGYHQSPTGPTWTSVGSDPEALAIRPNGFDGIVIVADTGSGDVRELNPRTDATTHATTLEPGASWNVGSSPVALSVGSFGTAVARRDSADVVILGSPQGVPAQSSPISLGASPLALATVNTPGDPAYGDLAVLGQDGTLTVLQQSSSAGGWPTFTQTPVLVPGHPTALVAQPIRPLLDYSAHAFALPPATDLALLDGVNGTATVLLQNPRLIVTPEGPTELGLPRTTAGTTSTADETVTNGGTTPARVDHISRFAPVPFWSYAFTVAPDRCSGRTLAPGASCTITIRFTPQTPGEFLDGINVFGGPDPSSILGVTRLRGNADLHANVTAPGVQTLTDVLRHGVRATAACSAACNVTLRATLSAGRGRTGHTISVAHVRFRRGGKTKLRVSLRAWSKTLGRVRRARLTLTSTAGATSYSAHGSKTISYKLGSVTVVLKSH